MTRKRVKSWVITFVVCLVFFEVTTRVFGINWLS